METSGHIDQIIALFFNKKSRREVLDSNISILLVNLEENRFGYFNYKIRYFRFCFKFVAQLKRQSNFIHLD